MDNVSQNTLIEYLMIDNIFDTLIKVSQLRFVIKRWSEINFRWSLLNCNTQQKQNNLNLLFGCQLRVFCRVLQFYKERSLDINLLLQLLSDANIRLKVGRDVILLLTLLVNYRKYETSNPYVIKLSILDSESSFNGYGLVRI